MRNQGPVDHTVLREELSGAWASEVPPFNLLVLITHPICTRTVPVPYSNPWVTSHSPLLLTISTKPSLILPSLFCPPSSAGHKETPSGLHRVLPPCLWQCKYVLSSPHARSATPEGISESPFLCSHAPYRASLPRLPTPVALLGHFPHLRYLIIGRALLLDADTAS